jgi:hypothetical protein
LTYTSPATSSSELTGAVPLLASGDRGLMTEKIIVLNLGLNKLNVVTVAKAGQVAFGSWAVACHGCPEH